MKKRILLILLIFILLVSVFYIINKNKSNGSNTNEIVNLKIIESNQKTLQKLDTNDIYDYSIYYYGVSNVIINYKNQELNLEDALKQEIVSMNDIIELLRSFAKENKIDYNTYLDGGTEEFKYNNYTIIKCNKEETGNKDVYIGNKYMTLSDIEDDVSTLSEDDDWLETY